MASEKHKWSLKVTYPEVSSPTLIKVRMRSPHANYIYRKHCKDGCFDPIDDMMVLNCSLFLYLQSWQLQRLVYSQSHPTS